MEKKNIKSHKEVKAKAEPKNAEKAQPKKTKIKKEKTAQSLLGLYGLKAPKGSHKKRKYLGRGPSSGHGKTSTRGSKGQTSRAGRQFYLGFEGGQSPLIRKMPKRGFTSNFKKIYQIVNLKDLLRVKEAVISPEILEQKGLIKNKSKLVKILGSGEIKSALTVQAHAFSKKAAQEIVKAGGKAEVVALVLPKS